MCGEGEKGMGDIISTRRCYGCGSTSFPAARPAVGLSAP